MRRFALWLLVALLALGGVVALGLLARERARQDATVYTDGRTIAVPASDAPLRSILWTPPEPLPGDVNTLGDDHQPRVSLDGSTLFFVRGRAGGNADIWWAKRDADAWAPPEPIDAINSPSDELTPCPTPSGDALVFASDRPAGAGGYDLWITRRDGDAWTEPVWLGDDVNTPHNDYAPGLSPDGLWLWYASNRPDKQPQEAIVSRDAAANTIDPFAPPPTPGDYDIYRARLAGDAATLVTRIEELCSPADDVSPAWSPQGDFVYLASDRARTDNADNGFDLYRARISDAVPLAPEPLGPTINTPRDEIDPGVALGGFELLFSIAIPADSADDSPDLDLARSLSREVYPVVDASRLRLDLSRLWDLFGPWLLWLLLLLLLLLLFVKFRSSHAAQGRWRKLSLLARCLLLSLLIHALLLALLGLWRVSTGIGDFLDEDDGMRIRLTSSRGGVATQLTGAFVAAPAQLASSEQTSRAQSQAEAAPATMMQASAQRSAQPAQRDESTLESSRAAEPVRTAEASAIQTPATDAPVTTPAPARAQAVAEHAEARPIAGVAEPARAQPAPAGATTTAAAIEPGARRDQSVAMRQTPAADAAPSAASDTAIPAPTPDTSPPPAPGMRQTEQAQRVAAGEQAPASALARPAPTSAPATAIDAGQHAASLASTGAEASPISPEPAASTTLGAAVAGQSTPSTRAPELAAPAQQVAQAETSRAVPVSEAAATGAPVAASATTALAAPSRSDAVAAASLVTSNPGRATLDARSTQTQSPAEGASTDAVAASSAPAVPPTETHASAGLPQAARLAAATEASRESGNTPAPTRPARAPGATNTPDEPDRFASITPGAAELAPQDQPTSAPPSDADAGEPAVAIAATGRPTPAAAALSLPAARDNAPDQTTSEQLAAAADQIDTTARESAPIAPDTSASTIERVAPASASIEPAAGGSAPTESAIADAAPTPSNARVRLADAAAALDARLPETPATGAPEVTTTLAQAASLSSDTTRPTIDQGEPARTAELDRLDPESTVFSPDASTDALSDRADAAPEPAYARSAAPARPGPALALPDASTPAPALADAGAPNAEPRPTNILPRAGIDASNSASPVLVRIDTPASTRIIDAPDATSLRAADAPPERTALALGLTPAAATPLDLPALPAQPEVYPQRDEIVRQELVERGGGSEETEKAVADALAWLARNQSQDGRWSSQGFQRIGGASGDPARYDFDVATTALALLCFLGADHTPLEQGPYQHNVARALDWLLAREGEPGEFRAGESMYSQAIATIALCESYAMTRDPRLVPPVQRAINFIVGARNDTVGGWRYEPGQPGDTSVLGWMVMSFESARRCGIDIDPAAPTTAHQWLDNVMDPDWPGRYAYRPGMESTRSMTAEGMFVRQLLKIDRDDPRQLGAARYVLQDLPRWNDDAPTYQWYYATLALFQHGGGAWDRWNRSMSRELVEAQRADGPAAGSWDPTDRYAQIGGRIYQTAICTLSLEVYYRYLPMYIDEPVAGMGGE